MADNGTEKTFIPGLFDRAKEVTFDVVFSELGLLDTLKVVGDEIKGKCPLCGGGSTANRGHEHHRSIRRCSVREGRPRRFGGAQRDSGT